MAKRKTRSRRAIFARIAFHGVVALVLIALVGGFIHETQTAMIYQAHGPPGSEHPFDWWAEACLAGVFFIVAVWFLSRPAPRRWRKSAARSAEFASHASGRAVKPRHRSGYNRPNDT